MIGLYNTAHLLSAKKLEGQLMKSISSGKDMDKLKYASNQSHFHKADWDARKMRAICDGLTSMEVSLGRDRYIAQVNYEATKLIRDTFAQMSALGSIGTTMKEDPSTQPTILGEKTFSVGLTGNTIPDLSSVTGFYEAALIEITDARIDVHFSDPNASVLSQYSYVYFMDPKTGTKKNIGNITSNSTVEFQYPYPDLRNYSSSDNSFFSMQRFHRLRLALTNI